MSRNFVRALMAAMLVLSVTTDRVAVEPLGWSRHGAVLEASAWSWEGEAVLEPSVIYDPDAGLFKMWYRGGGLGAVRRPDAALGYATSVDGRTWVKHPGNPIFGNGVGGESGTVHQPHVYKIDDRYYLYYQAAAGSTRALKLATSDDGLTWSVAGTVLELSGGLISWGNNAVWREDPDTWWMLIEAFNGTIWQIYLATSANGERFRFEKNGAPLTSLQVAAGGMYGGPDLPSPEKVDGLYQIWYHAARAPGTLPTDIYHATSADLINWTAVAPTLEHSGSDYEIDQIADPCVIEVHGVTYMFYDADDNVADVAAIKLATYNGRIAELVRMHASE